MQWTQNQKDTCMNAIKRSFGGYCSQSVIFWQQKLIKWTQKEENAIKNKIGHNIILTFFKLNLILKLFLQKVIC